MRAVLVLLIHITIAQQEVSLNSTLFLGKYARPRQRVTFTCEARDTSVLEWYSEEYIGPGGDVIEIIRTGDGSNQTRRGGETVATAVSVNTFSGVTVIVSQLHIMTSEQIPTSSESVTCAIDGNGPQETISFTTTAVPLQSVTLNHTLYLGEYARPGQRVTFTCEARDTSILEWYSEEYIGPGGDVIEIIRTGDGNNQTRRGGETVATAVSINTYSGITVIVSQLHIMTSEQIPTSSVTCAIDGNGLRETISFTTTDSIPEITSTFEPISTTPDNQFHTTAKRDSNNNNNIIVVIAVVPVLCGGGVIIGVSLGLVVIIMCARIKSRRKSKVYIIEMQLEQQPDDVTDKKPDPQKDEYGMKQANENKMNHIKTEESLVPPRKEANEEPDGIVSLKKAEKEPLLKQQQQQQLQQQQQVGGASQQTLQPQQRLQPDGGGVICDSANKVPVEPGKDTSNIWKQPVKLTRCSSLPSVHTCMYTDVKITYSSLSQLNVDDSTPRVTRSNSEQRGVDADIESGSDTSVMDSCSTSLLSLRSKDNSFMISGFNNAVSNEEIIKEVADPHCEADNVHQEVGEVPLSIDGGFTHLESEIRVLGYHSLFPVSLYGPEGSQESYSGGTTSGVGHGGSTTSGFDSEIVSSPLMRDPSRDRSGVRNGHGGSTTSGFDSEIASPPLKRLPSQHRSGVRKTQDLVSVQQTKLTHRHPPSPIISSDDDSETASSPLKKRPSSRKKRNMLASDTKSMA